MTDPRNATAPGVETEGEAKDQQGRADTLTLPVARRERTGALADRARREFDTLAGPERRHEPRPDAPLAQSRIGLDPGAGALRISQMLTAGEPLAAPPSPASSCPSCGARTGGAA